MWIFFNYELKNYDSFDLIIIKCRLCYLERLLFSDTLKSSVNRSDQGQNN